MEEESPMFLFSDQNCSDDDSSPTPDFRNNKNQTTFSEMTPQAKAISKSLNSVTGILVTADDDEREEATVLDPIREEDKMDLDEIEWTPIQGEEEPLGEPEAAMEEELQQEVEQEVTKEPAPDTAQISEEVSNQQITTPPRGSAETPENQVKFTRAREFSLPDDLSPVYRIPHANLPEHQPQPFSMIGNSYPALVNSQETVLQQESMDASSSRFSISEEVLVNTPNRNSSICQVLPPPLYEKPLMEFKTSPGEHSDPFMTGLVTLVEFMKSNRPETSAENACVYLTLQFYAERINEKISALSDLSPVLIQSYTMMDCYESCFARTYELAIERMQPEFDLPMLDFLISELRRIQSQIKFHNKKLELQESVNLKVVENLKESLRYMEKTKQNLLGFLSERELTRNKTLADLKMRASSLLGEEQKLDGEIITLRERIGQENLMAEYQEAQFIERERRLMEIYEKHGWCIFYETKEFLVCKIPIGFVRFSVESDPARNRYVSFDKLHLLFTCGLDVSSLAVKGLTEVNQRLLMKERERMKKFQFSPLEMHAYLEPLIKPLMFMRDLLEISALIASELHRKRKSGGVRVDFEVSEIGKISALMVVEFYNRESQNLLLEIGFPTVKQDPTGLKDEPAIAVSVQGPYKEQDEQRLFMEIRKFKSSSITDIHSLVDLVALVYNDFSTWATPI
jgi:hypothetical protein